MKTTLHNIDLKLTPASAILKGLEWYSDEPYSKDKKEYQIYFVNCEVDLGAKLGLPKEQRLEDGFVGLYKKARNIKLPKIHWDLNPENASQQNLVWVSDTIMDPEAPDEANKEFSDLEKKGYKFGMPSDPKTTRNCFVGKYKPLD